MSENRLRKLQEQNRRLREQLELPRIATSEASRSLITYVTQTRDTLVPSVWGPPTEDRWSPKRSGMSCCTVL
ncbi:Guanine nucleotide-binding protein subunit gamma [Dimargaris cristalligena]|uniref:Guanine nucleotide-binding protein subunit gamma n=1 Tax=Dimargaris cristalligena TaxID=215637 RepID=A0A4P9ZWS2_9FUNG|nr:Guanine nucleotide-binding protein subunit gamma [Dimargaris cristalligena]RKP38073.1 G-protein gamma-like domain-containing protein [Dimargaris cristalligena]|eukprot:RKP38073.1 G-protein gamma-like domain-containing protein [Dimargaris cristalligena]